MQIPASSPDRIRPLTKLLAGAIAAAAVWLVAGAPEIAWLGFVLAAVTTEPRSLRACRPGAAWRSRA